MGYFKGLLGDEQHSEEDAVGIIGNDDRDLVGRCHEDLSAIHLKSKRYVISLSQSLCLE